MHAFRRLLQQRSAVPAVLQGMLAVAIAVLCLWFLGRVLLLVFAAALLAILIATPARWLSQHTGLGYGWSVALVVALAVFAFVGAGMALAPQVAAQADQVSAELPGALHQVIGDVKGSAIGRMLTGQIRTGSGAALAAPLLNSVSSLVTAIGSIVFIAFVGLYLAVTPGGYARGALRLVPPERRDRAREIGEAVVSALKHFLFGRLFSMCVIALCSTIGLWALGVPAPIALGLLAGAMSFVPYVGSAASALPPLLLSYIRDPLSAVYVIALYVGIHVLDGYVLVPLVQRRMVHMLPAVTLTAQLALGVLWGLLGVALATPIAAALMTVIEMAYVEDRLERRAGEDDAGLGVGGTATR